MELDNTMMVKENLISNSGERRTADKKYPGGWLLLSGYVRYVLTRSYWRVERIRCRVGQWHPQHRPHLPRQQDDVQAAAARDLGLGRGLPAQGGGDCQSVSRDPAASDAEERGHSSHVRLL